MQQTQTTKGRPSEGRVRANIAMLPAAWSGLDKSRGKLARGKFIEGILARLKSTKPQSKN